MMEYLLGSGYPGAAQGPVNVSMSDMWSQYHDIHDKHCTERTPIFSPFSTSLCARLLIALLVMAAKATANTVGPSLIAKWTWSPYVDTL